MVTLLRRVQNELFDAGADLATPLPPSPPEYPQLRIDEGYVTALEAACDSYNADLAVLRSFVLPGRHPGRRPAAHRAGGDPAGRAHRLGRGRRPRGHGQPVARPLPEPALGPALHPGPGGQHQASGGAGDVLWKPGGSR